MEQKIRVSVKSRAMIVRLFSFRRSDPPAVPMLEYEKEKKLS
ncbi:hypothetical protein GCAAIG_11105 [Candidatus Electronema halotolerans]